MTMIEVRCFPVTIQVSVWCVSLLIVDSDSPNQRGIEMRKSLLCGVALAASLFMTGAAWADAPSPFNTEPQYAELFTDLNATDAVAIGSAPDTGGGKVMFTVHNYDIDAVPTADRPDNSGFHLSAVPSCLWITCFGDKQLTAADDRYIRRTVYARWYPVDADTRVPI